MEAACINYNESETCNLNINCGWCPNPNLNGTSCGKNYACYSKEVCYDSKNEICGLIELLHNATITAGVITGFILILLAVSKYLMNRGLNRETSLSIGGMIGISISFPIVITFFFYFNKFFIVFTIFLSTSLLVNLIFM